MDDLIQLLHEGKHSLVVANGEVCTFNGRGVIDLYHLLQDDPGFLYEASIADKVVGKAAAALLALAKRCMRMSSVGLPSTCSQRQI